MKKYAYRQALRRFEAVRDWTTNDTFESHADAIDFLCDYADALRNCGQHKRALELLDEAKALLPDDWKDLKARILWTEGGIHSLGGCGEIAEEYMLKALRIYRELDDPDGEIQALGSLAYLCDVSGRPSNLDLNTIVFGHSIYFKEFIFIWVITILRKQFAMKLLVNGISKDFCTGRQ